MKRDQSHPVGLLMTRFMFNEFASSKAQDFPEDSLHSELRKRKGYSHYRMRSVKEKVEDAKFQFKETDVDVCKGGTQSVAAGGLRKRRHNRQMVAPAMQTAEEKHYNLRGHKA
ncbi:hypothetical protein RHGRI_026992 [Rhododendron griersonianum]|uniref:Uncharacterized protein n=1 Tax=Rhododendron griersonianum TaxID=479676 RepID=A0AAV6IUK7_9ERIC|nr:hypothetical protein RHGRI_026992 [Rhododendron griersonianum]